MKQLTIFSILMFAFSLTGHAQNKKSQDQNAIKQMCGCYEVTFDFSETFQYSNDSSYVPSKVKHDRGLEWVEPVHDADNKIVLQHLLIVGPPTQQKVIKHWRQDWLYENTDLYTYNANNIWKYQKLSDDAVKGQWTQKVFQVDDSPRYEGTATWVHVDGKSFWENTTDAPLPRREYTKREDYNVTVRGNRHEITSFGWIHDQDNLKVIRTTSEDDKVLAKEKGLNTYTKVADAKCQVARDWWKEHHQDWSMVRHTWDQIFAERRDLQLKASYLDKPLYGHLFSDDFSMTQTNIETIIKQFLIN